MDNIKTGVLIAHTLIALVIIALVLLQRGKGADAGAAFGSGASGTVFGSRGSTSFFSRLTAILATVFFATSLGLAYLSGQHAAAPESLLDDAPAVDEVVLPAGEPADDEALPELPAADDGAEAADDLPSLPPAEDADETTGQE